MDTLKKFGKYVLWIILFWILSDVLIYFGINSTYKDIEQRGEIPAGIEIIQMQATNLKGRATVKVTSNDLNGKALKIDLYSKSGINLGTQYIDLNDKKQGDEIQTYFKISRVKSYEIAVVEEMGESTEGFMDTAFTSLTILGVLIKVLFI